MRTNSISSTLDDDQYRTGRREITIWDFPGEKQDRGSHPLLSKLVPVLVVVLSNDRENRANEPKYTTKYDNIDLDQILKNDRILRNYVDCCLGKKKCTSDGEELKSYIKDAIENECDKCSDSQKRAVKKVGRKLYTDKPEWWKELCDHFDPEGLYRKKYQAFIEEALAEGED
ncbi:hypothetical protein JTB14_005417 [Gonioctena quinquepunctata]|nr:hypothetical protein JTB14_005417 [Gonioctena quinquepunctata]